MASLHGSAASVDDKVASTTVAPVGENNVDQVDVSPWIALKNEGNMALKNEKYEEAIGFYTRGINILEQQLVKISSGLTGGDAIDAKAATQKVGNEKAKEMAVLLNNRATALVKISEFDRAKVDATKSISFNKMYFKAYWRLSECEQNLGNLNAALDVLYKCLDLDKGLYGDPKLKEQFSYTRKLKNKLYNKFPQIPIEKYAFSDGRKKVSAYIDLPGISQVRKEDIIMKCESKSLDLRVHGIDNQCYRLYAPELWQKVVPEKCKFKIKKEKEQLVVILAKVNTEDIHSSWEHLRRQ
eukprot:g4978.t1